MLVLAVTAGAAIASTTRARKPSAKRSPQRSERSYTGEPELQPRGGLREDRFDSDATVSVVAPAITEDGRLPTVSVVVPALNEEGCIDWVLQHIPSWVCEVVLVDGLSTDRTEAVARRMRPDLVVVHQRQRGKGAALRAGFAAASGDIVVMIDADGSTDPREMHRFVDALESGADFVKGSRHLAHGGSVDFTLLRRAGNRGFVLLANLIYASRFTDLCYGYCAFWRRHLDALALTADGFEIETQLVLSAVKAGLEIHEVPSLELERRAGKSNLNAFRDGCRVLATMLRERPANARAKAAGAPIDLMQVEVAALESDAWMPAGKDRRRIERRNFDRLPAEYRGQERRRSQRRAYSDETSVVYVVCAGATTEREEIAVERAA